MRALLGEAQLPDADLALLRDDLALPDTRGTDRGLVASGSLAPLCGMTCAYVASSTRTET